ncbi:MAG: YidC/Oxa1 family membrane protein insertase [Halioglobus sp.]
MIYQYTLAPIESVLETIFLILVGLSNSYFLSLVLLALVVRLATKPLEKYASRAQSSQAEIESVLAPQIDKIKRQFTAAARHEATRRLYKRYAYHPVLAARSLAGLGVQLPFFIAAYFMLSGSEVLLGEVVPLLGDLGKPDTLLFGSFHLMPFVMTAVNILALVTAPGFNRRSRVQGLVVSTMFLVLLYEAPLALLIYWTTSNLFSLASNFSPSVLRKLGLKLSGVHLKSTWLGRGFEEYAYLFFVCNLAILVPLLGVLGDQFNFFTAHNLPGSKIMQLLLIAGCGPALILMPLRWLSKRLGFSKVFDGAVLFVFLGLFVFYIANSAGYGIIPTAREPYILLGVAFLISVGAVVSIMATQSLRILSYLSLLVPLLLLDFMYASPASTLFNQSGGAPSADIAGKNDTPVFLLVFDEFSGLTLQKSGGGLDEARYPGFAELAAQSDFFPNALTVDYHTSISVPSIASGTLRVGEKIGLARGENLLEMFLSHGGVHAFSTVLPAELMYRQDTNQDSLISDFLTLYVHIISHKDWIEDRIGVIPQTWKGFGVFFREGNQRQLRQGVNPQVGHFFDWLSEINNAKETSQFNFLHIEFPHAHYTTTALGRAVRNGRAILPLLKDTEDLVADQVLLNVAYHNYMQQSAYVDLLLQDFIAVLRSRDLFDRSMVIITADHGVSYNRKGANRRVPVNEDSWKNIVSVPLFIKYPQQAQGHVEPSFVTTLDIYPTIMDVLEFDVPWEIAGQSLRNQDLNGQTKSVDLVFGYKKYFGNISVLFSESRQKKATLFGEGSPVHDVAVNYTEDPGFNHLLGTDISALIDNRPSELHVVWNGSLQAVEVSYFGGVYLNSQPVNNKVIAAVVDSKVKSVFRSAHSLKRNGFFAFSLPESEASEGEFDVSLYEIEPGAPLKFSEITARHENEYLAKEFVSKTITPYDWKNSVRETNGLDDLKSGKNGLLVQSSESIDPFVVFEPVSKSAVDQPMLRIVLESNRALSLNLYYQTTHKQAFDSSQRLEASISKGLNTIYIQIPEDDFSGPFRIDTGFGGATEVLIKDIELRH